jgi:hypothetical protein
VTASNQNSKSAAPVTHVRSHYFRRLNSSPKAFSAVECQKGSLVVGERICSIDQSPALDASVKAKHCS